MHLIHKVIALF